MSSDDERIRQEAAAEAERERRRALAAERRRAERIADQEKK